MSWVLEQDDETFILSIKLDTRNVHCVVYMYHGAFRSGNDLRNPTNNNTIISFNVAENEIKTYSRDLYLKMKLPQESFQQLYQTLITDLTDLGTNPVSPVNQLEEAEYTYDPEDPNSNRNPTDPTALEGGRRRKQTHRKRRKQKSRKN